MPIKITDTKVLTGEGGTYLRFAIEVFADAESEMGMATKGFLAFRNGEGGITIAPPVTMLSKWGKAFKYRGTSITPKLVDAAVVVLERDYGQAIKADFDWNELRKQRIHDKQKQRKKDGFVL